MLGHKGPIREGIKLHFLTSYLILIYIFFDDCKVKTILVTLSCLQARIQAKNEPTKNLSVSRLCPMFPRFLPSLDRFYSEEFCFYSMVAIFCTGGWDIIFSILIYVEKSVTFHIKMYLRESNMV